MSQNKNSKSSKYPARRHRPFYKRLPFRCFAFVVIAVGIFFAVKYFIKPSEPPKNSEVSNTSTKNQTNETKATKPNQEANNKTSETTNPTISPDGKTPEKYEGGDPNNLETLTGSITTARFENDKLIIRVNIDQYLSGGTCTLYLSDGTNNLEKTANIIPVASTSSCEGFDIENAELLNFSRPIDINIALSSNDKTGNIAWRIE